MFWCLCLFVVSAANLFLLPLPKEQNTNYGVCVCVCVEVKEMGAIKVAIGDAILTFMWVFLSSTMSAMTALIATALGLETLVWPSVLITISIVFVLALKLDLIVSSGATVEFLKMLGKSKNLFSRDFAIGFTESILIISSGVLKSIGWIFIDKGMINVIKNHEKILNSTSNPIYHFVLFHRAYLTAVVTRL